MIVSPSHFILLCLIAISFLMRLRRVDLEKEEVWRNWEEYKEGRGSLMLEEFDYIDWSTVRRTGSREFKS